MKTLLYTFIAIAFLSCSSTTNKSSEESEPLTPESDTQTKTTLPSGLCIWKEVAIRETPSEKGKYVTSVSLGEEFEVTSDTATETINSKKHLYHLIKLSDGTTGWIRKDFIAINAKAGAFIAEAIIYKRPDLMTATKKSFNYLDYVAVINTNDAGWSEVVGKRRGDKWFTTGWVRDENITNLDVDVHFSALYNVILEIPGEIERQKEIDKLFLSDMFTESVFHQQNGDNTEEFSEGAKAEDFIEAEAEYSEVDTTSIDQ